MIFAPPPRFFRPCFIRACRRNVYQLKSHFRFTNFHFRWPYTKWWFVLYSTATTAAGRTAAAFIVSQSGQDAKGSPKCGSTGFGADGNHSRIAWDSRNAQLRTRCVVIHCSLTLQCLNAFTNDTQDVQGSSAKLTNQRVSCAFTSSPLSFHARHILPIPSSGIYSCILLTFLQTSVTVNGMCENCKCEYSSLVWRFLIGMIG